METKKKHVPTVDEINEEWRKGIVGLVNEPHVEEKTMESLKQNIELAITFIQGLYPRIHDKYPAPGYTCTPEGSICFGWSRERLGLFLSCTIEFEENVPQVDILKSVPGQRDVFENLAFSTEQEQEKAIDMVLEMLKEIPPK